MGKVTRMAAFWGALIVAVSLFASPARAAPFCEGRMAFQVVSGALSALSWLPSDSPDLEYAQTNVRLGWMLTDPKPVRFLGRGNVEVLLEVTNSFVYEGFGDYMGGITALVRYNWVRPDWKVVPYVQLGAGIIYNDLYKEDSQSAIGQSIEFTPQGSLGLHFIITEDWALDVEAMLHHVSNAGMAKRNRSINAVGGFVGLTYFMEYLWK